MNTAKRILDESIELKVNAMLKHRPELLDEWNFEKNDELGIDIYKLSYGSGKKVWWICSICKEGYDMSANQRVGSNSNCPYCAGFRVNSTNSLATLNPILSAEWHPVLNGELTPHEISHSNSQKTWWLGKCGHEWDATINNRHNKNSGCPFCSNMKVLIGFNDMWTTNPVLASLLLNPEDGYKYMQNSTESSIWKCPECESVIENKKVMSINRFGLTCPRCSDKIHFPEKFMYNLLKEADIDFVYDESRKWSEGKRYDFYLSEHSTIIEVHGEQHYNGSFKTFKKGRTLTNEINNDILKEKLAKENGIDKYIVIDARESTVEWIRDSVLSSDIMNLLPNIDFVRVGRLSNSSLVKIASDFWDSGIRSSYEISLIMKLTVKTVRKYLQRGAEIGWCDYSTEQATKERASRLSREKIKSVVQLTVGEVYIKEWESMKEAGLTLGILSSDISLTCRNKKELAGEFKWMYIEDYDTFIGEQKDYK